MARVDPLTGAPVTHPNPAPVTRKRTAPIPPPSRTVELEEARDGDTGAVYVDVDDAVAYGVAVVSRTRIHMHSDTFAVVSGMRRSDREQLKRIFEAMLPRGAAANNVYVFPPVMGFIDRTTIRDAKDVVVECLGSGPGADVEYAVQLMNSIRGQMQELEAAYELLMMKSMEDA